MPHAPAPARRRGEARRAAGRRFPDRAPGDVACGSDGETNDHALPQLPRDGDRGAVALPSDRRRRAARRLRQDHPRPRHGRDQHGAADDLRAGRADAARQLAGQVPRLGLGRLEILGREARRQNQRSRVGRDRERDRALVRHLHDHGHRRHHDGDRRGDGVVAARRIVDPGGRQQSSAHGHAKRTAHRRNGVGRPHHRARARPELVRKRHQGAHGDGRLDQRHHPCGRDGEARGRADFARRFRPHLAQGAGDRERAALWRVSDGRFLLRGRPARADVRAARSA